MTSTPVEVGTLIVVILKAKNLPNKRHIGKQDPYCCVKLNSETRRTKAIKRGGQHPEWDEEVRFTIYEDVEDELARTAAENGTEDTPPPVPPKKERKKVHPGKKMQLMCYADDPREPDLIGETMVDLTEVLTKGETDEWFTLTNKEKYCGEVYLELTFWSNEKPPERHSTPQASAFHPQYGGPGSFTPSTDLPTSLMHGGSSQNTPSPSRIASSSGTDSTLPLPPSLRPSGSLAQINLYSAPYEQRNRYAEVDQLADNMGDLGVNPSQRRESFPPVQIAPSEFGYTGGPKHHNGSFSTISSSSSLSSIHSLGNVTGSRPSLGHQSSLSSLPESFPRDSYSSGPPHHMGPITDSFTPQPTYQLPQAPSTFAPASQTQPTPHPSQYNVTPPASHPTPSGFTAPPPPSSSMSFHIPQPPPPQLQLQPQYPTPSQTPLPYPVYGSPHPSGPPYQYTPQDGSLPPPSFPLTTHGAPQVYGQHATTPPHQNQQPTPAHSAFQPVHTSFPTTPGSRPLPNPQAQQKPRPEQQPSSTFASPPPGPSPPMASGAVMYPSATPFQPPGPPPPPPRRSSLPPTPTKTPSLGRPPPPPPPPPPPLPLQNGVHESSVSHLNPPPPLPPSLLPSHFRDIPPAVGHPSQQLPPAQQPPSAQQTQGYGSWVPPPPPPNIPPSGFSSQTHAPPPSNFLTMPAQNQQSYYESGPSNSPARFPTPQVWDPPPQQYPPQHVGYGSQDGWHQ